MTEATENMPPVTADIPEPVAPSPQVDRMAAARAARAAKKATEAAATPEPVAPSPLVAAQDDEAHARAAEALGVTSAAPTTLEKVAINEEQSRQRKIDALRAAKLGGHDPTKEAMVQVRVLKRGGGLISMGEHVGGLGELTYDAGETPSFPASIAQALEDKGLVEI